jgi:hypothetical protein
VAINRQRLWKYPLAATLGTWFVIFGTSAEAQIDAYTASYCEPTAETRLLYTNRAYEIERKPADAPPLYYTYKILAPSGRSQHVERAGQFLFDDSSDHWDLQTSSNEIEDFWPLQPGKELDLHRINRRTNVTDNVSFLVLGLEPIGRGLNMHLSWKIRRLDGYNDGTQSFQYLWYAPDICTLSAFTDSQHRLVRLLRVLRPGDRDYDRPLKVEQHYLYFADTNERVK